MDAAAYLKRILAMQEWRTAARLLRESEQGGEHRRVRHHDGAHLREFGIELAGAEVSSKARRDRHLRRVETAMSAFPRTVRSQWWALTHGRAMELELGPARVGAGELPEWDGDRLVALAQRRLRMVGERREAEGLGDVDRKSSRRLLGKIDPQWCRLRVLAPAGHGFGVGSAVSVSATSVAIGSMAAHLPARGYPVVGTVASVEDVYLAVLGAHPTFAFAKDLP